MFTSQSASRKSLVLRYATEIVQSPNRRSVSDPDVAVKVAIFLLNIFLGFASVLWGILFVLVDKSIDSAKVCWSFTALAVFGVILIVMTKKKVLPGLLLIFSILVIPGALHMQMGGFQQSSGVILWSAFAPVLAGILFHNRLVSGLLLVISVAFQCVVFGLFDLGPELSPFARPFREFPSSSRSVTTSVLLIIPNVVIPGLALGSLTLIFISRSKTYQQRISEMLLDTGIPSDVIAYSTSVRPPPFGFHFDFLAFGFIDIVGFTQWTSSVLPEVMLSTLVEYFDAIKNVKGPFERVEIVKFIGDSIMFVSGRPKLSPSGRRSKRARGPKGANLSGSLAPAAETYGTESIMSTDDTTVSLDSRERTAAVDELLNFLKRVMEVISTTPFGPESKKFQLRAGVEAGECIGGLLKSGAMDYYGDTVNVASRLEGTGSPGMIHLSRTVMSYASPKKGMAFGPVTRTEIKGHQALDTVLL